MNFRFLFVLNAILAAAAGVFFMVLPETVLTLFGTEVYVSTLFVARFLGGALLMSGILLWLLKEFGGIQRTLGMTLLGGSVVGFALALIGMTSSGVIRANGWVLLVIYGVFALAYAFLLFAQSQMTGGYKKQV